MTETPATGGGWQERIDLIVAYDPDLHSPTSASHAGRCAWQGAAGCDSKPVWSLHAPSDRPRGNWWAACRSCAAEAVLRVEAVPRAGRLLWTDGDLAITAPPA